MVRVSVLFRHKRICLGHMLWILKAVGAHIPLIVFSYNNSNHKSVKCAPFEALYGQKYRSPVIWAEVGEKERVEIVYREVKKLKRKWIPNVKVRWNSQRGVEFTWDREDQFKAKYQHLFATTSSATVAS
ncbi:putative reverse transcriptase domain-containing protein [Tanacetum coccineum]|uniref:Reverse transcriptase domain-containing protein n=1 Tax=Tanacetum coccineum TaxID=301880 RepID=A0ABQ5H9D1_9ASTR